jgi:tetratricopeptide (TPR) repeat protein
MRDRIGKYTFLIFFCSTSAGQVLSQTSSNLANEYQRDLGARTSFARGETMRASDTLQATSKANPFDPVALNNLAVTQAAQGDYLNAVASLERAYRLAPNRADIASNLKNLQLWIGQSNISVNSGRPASPLIFPRAEDLPPEVPALWGRMDGLVQPLARSIADPPMPATSVTGSAPTTASIRSNNDASLKPEITVLTPSSVRTKRK